MRTVFFGTPEFAVASLRALADSSHEVAAVVAQPDRPAGRGMRLSRPAVADEALERHITLLQPAKIRTAEFLQIINDLQPDLGIVVAYGRILPDGLLSIPKLGFVNVHGSLLPRYRGAAPIQRAIENRERETGITIMRVDSELDHGPMLRSVSTPIGLDETTPELAARLATIGASALVEVIDAMARGEALEVEQDHERATHAPKIEKAEGVVRWQESAAALYARHRAFLPWPGLTATFQGEAIKLTAVRPAAGNGAPGEVLQTAPYLIVAAGEGALQLVSLQRSGKTPVDGSTFARSAELVTGMTFG